MEGAILGSSRLVWKASARSWLAAAWGPLLRQKGQWREVVMSTGVDIIGTEFKCWAYQ